MGSLEGDRGAGAPEAKNVEITDEYREMFVVEAREHLDEWEAALLALENQPGNDELVNEMFRAIHTLKGSAGFIGFRTLQELAHELESGLQRVRDHETVLDASGTQLLFEGHDLSKRMVESYAAGREWDEDITEFMQKLSKGSLVAGAAAPAGEQAPRTLDIEISVTATGRESFLRAFLARTRLGALGTIIAEQPAPETFKAAGGPFTYVATVETDRSETVIRTELNIDQIVILSIAEHAAAGVPPAADTAARGASAPAAGGASNATRHDEVVRVSVERLDNLLNLVGELVVQNSNFVSVAEHLKGLYGRTEAVLSLEDKTEGLSKITRDLQDGIMKVRMLPINTVFMRFPRVVRDLAHTSGKQVTLDIFGGDTEIDKKVIDRIGDPLVHLIRNAVDHGIEQPDERVASGKSSASVVRLGAYQDGDHICVEVTDDGKGLDRNAILAKARERGLLAADDAHLSDAQVFDLIFLPGFSTAQRITDVSGRGVGMDVVKRAIEELGGSIRLRSFPSKGTTVTIVLPLTMAIIRAVLVEVDDITVAIPLSSVKEILKFEGTGLRTVGGRHVMQLREEVLAVVHMREVLDLENDDAWTSNGMRTPVVVVDYDSRKIGLGVSRVLGTQEVVIKSLSRHYEEVDGFIGASILGDGRIALIADIEAIVPRFYHSNSPFGPSGDATVPDAPFREESAEAREQAGEEAPPSSDEAEYSTETEDHKEAESQPEGEEGGAREEATMEALNNIGSSGAVRASMALSQLTRTETRVGFPESRMVKISEIAEPLGGEEAEVAGIYVGINGDLAGGVLIVISREQLAEITSLLLGGAPDTEEPADPEELSAVAEFGNLLSASFINAMADETDKAIHIDPPEITVDMCLPVVDSVVARFNVDGDRILLTRASVYFGESEEVACNLLLFLEAGSLDELLESLATVSS